MQTASSTLQANGKPPSDLILSARGLCMDFLGFRAVDNVSIDVGRGSIHALIGPNGAGKSTCFNLLTKFLLPTAGSIEFDGRDVTSMSPAAIAQLGLVRSFQISAVFAHLTVYENVGLALQRKRGQSYDFWNSIRSLSKSRDEAYALLESVGLEGEASNLAANLSYGRKRALEIATTLALSPKMMLLDEPTAGMAHHDVDRVVELIQKIRKGRTILMVEHNLSVVQGLCDRITVLARGKILAEGSYQQVSTNPEVVSAYLGTPTGDVVA